MDQSSDHGPTMGAAANLTLMSYNKHCYIGVTTDTAAIPDPDLFLQCIKDGFADLVTATRR